MLCKRMNLRNCYLNYAFEIPEVTLLYLNWIFIPVIILFWQPLRPVSFRPRSSETRSEYCLSPFQQSIGFGAQLIGPIQLHVKRQNSSICKFFQGIAWTFCCLWMARSVIRKYFNIVDLCGILPYKRMCPHWCGGIIYNCISSPFLYYNQYAWVQISFVMIS